MWANRRGHVIVKHVSPGLVVPSRDPRTSFCLRFTFLQFQAVIADTRFLLSFRLWGPFCLMVDTWGIILFG